MPDLGNLNYIPKYIKLIKKLTHSHLTFHINTHGILRIENGTLHIPFVAQFR